MNKTLTGLFIVVFLLFPIIQYAQEGNAVIVEVSKEKVLINGKNFYLHTVKKGENLYRISKAYNVTQKDIVIANPETISGTVKEGQVLKIPVDPATPRSIQQIESDNFIYHITEEQQTIFFITQKYAVSKEELFKYNPELEYSPLQVGQVLRIPKTQGVSSNAESFQPIENYIEHKVKRKETKYSISKEYDITVDELIAANPVLNSEDLKAGSYIRIPRKSNTKFNTKELVQRADSIAKIKKNQKNDLIKFESITNKPYSGELKIALLLPFSIEENETRAKLDSAAAANAAKKPNKPQMVRPPSTELLPRTIFSIEFYQGFLLAVDSLKKTGISIKINTYDTERDVARVNKILTQPALSEMDLVVGPFFSEAMEKANEFSISNKVLLVSPIINENDYSPNPNLFQFLPNPRVSVNALVQYATKIENKKIIFIETSDPQDKTIVQLFKDHLNTFFPNEVNTVSSSSLNDINKYYSENEENIVFVPSTNEAFIFTLFSKLNLDAKNYHIKVFGMPNSARFKNIDLLYFHNLEFHYYTPFYFEHTQPEIKQFVHKYKNKYKFEPLDFTKEGYNFAMLGYDLGSYFIQTLSKSDGNLDSIVNNKQTQLTHMKLRFLQDSITGNYINQNVQIMKFTKDFYLRKAD